MVKLYKKTLLIAAFITMFSCVKGFVLPYSGVEPNAVSFVDPFNFKVYPNPATGGSVQISFDFSNTDYRNVSFSISNVIGQSLFSYTLKEDDFKNGKFTIDLEELKLEKGVYLVKMSSGDHSRIQKLVLR